MKLAAGAGIAAVIFAIAAARAQGDGPAVPARPAQPAPADWGEWTRPLQPHSAHPRPAPAEAPQSPAPAAVAAEIDVVDAHWMALTMWGEARNGGEAAMRAVGHVIDNRHRAGTHGTYVTEAVSEAWQFSCWNRGDPNYAAIMNIDALPADSEDRRMWVTAKRVAEEILSGQSADPTGGALFYHTAAVSPRWSAGVAPVAQIGGHLFFRTAR
ncbi:MAG: N-acetylmuramoyl-L-alanine amidase [Sphingomonadales bacterium]|jgi:spore germination cell wall hydrolase CwlJ-like protein|nr:N-acetylmuramoyl-L-alanine amidase [Sphingomonadales bacterium]